MDTTDTIEPSAAAPTSLSPEQAEARKKVLGASEIPSLFECGYKTRLELWLEKAGQVESADIDSEFVRAGVYMEPGIARWVADRTGFKLRHVSEHLTHPQCAGWGASLDYKVVDHPDGEAPCEIKRVHWMVGKRSWMVSTGEEEAPPHIEIQLQAQIGAFGSSWGVIGADVGGNLICIERPRVDGWQEAIGEEVDNFWESIRKGDPPQVDLQRDLEVLQRLYPDAAPKKIIPLTDDLRQHVKDYEIGGTYRSAGEKLQEAAKTAILWLAGDAEAIDLGDWDGEPKFLMMNNVARKGYTVEPTSYRRMAFAKPPKEKK